MPAPPPGLRKGPRGPACPADDESDLLGAALPTRVTLSASTFFKIVAHTHAHTNYKYTLKFAVCVCVCAHVCSPPRKTPALNALAVRVTWLDAFGTALTCTLLVLLLWRALTNTPRGSLFFYQVKRHLSVRGHCCESIRLPPVLLKCPAERPVLGP